MGRSSLILAACLSSFLFVSFGVHAKIRDASDIIKRSEDNIRGQSQEGRLSMVILSKGKERKIRFDFWSKDRNKTLIKLLEPIKEAGSGNLRVDLNLWRYLANVDRVIKVPASMMLQSWMGSDFTYDDMVRTSSLFQDYKHKVIEEKNGIVTIECLPNENAPVVWGKVIEKVRLKGFVTLERAFYNEKGEVIRTMTGEDIREVDGHFIPFKLTMVSHKKGDSQTVLKYEKLKFNLPISSDIFTQAKMKER